jgi:hypothetical protein
MHRVGFESTIPAFELAKEVHALYHATTVIGLYAGTVCILAAAIVRHQDSV